MTRCRWIALVAAALAVALATAGTATAASQHRHGDTYTVTPLVSNNAALAPTVDPNLRNGWGISAGPVDSPTPWWVSNQASDTSTLYNGAGAVLPLVVTVPGGPTGTVFFGGTSSLLVQGTAGMVPAKFLFSTLSGTIQGWPPGTTATVTAVDSSKWHAVYTGLAINGDVLYAADFANGRVDVFDGKFQPVKQWGMFKDRWLPHGYSPFGIQAIGDYIFVTYAKVDPVTHRSAAGKGLGIVDAYSPQGKFLQRVATGGRLDAPWGVAWAPETGFGSASGSLLVGNFGDGYINTFRMDHKGRWKKGGQLMASKHKPVWIDGLWGIGFGNGGAAGPTNVLYFAAGPNHEVDGLYGTVSATTP